MADTFNGHSVGLTAPGEHAFAITPNNSADLDIATRAIYVGGNGNLKITTVGGDTVTLTGVVAGMIYPLRAVRVWSTGTTATSLIGVY